VRERLLALGVRHLLEVVAVAVGERGHGSADRRLAEEVVRKGHAASMARRR
jgi:hypothetical protein